MEALNESKVKVPFNLTDTPYPDSIYQPLYTFYFYFNFTFDFFTYAVSKLFGEELGRLYAWRYGVESVALRIGWIKDFQKGICCFQPCLSSFSYQYLDNPSDLKGSISEGYMRAMYLCVLKA